MTIALEVRNLYQKDFRLLLLSLHYSTHSSRPLSTEVMFFANVELPVKPSNDTRLWVRSMNARQWPSAIRVGCSETGGGHRFWQILSELNRRAASEPIGPVCPQMGSEFVVHGYMTTGRATVPMTADAAPRREL